MSDNRKYYYLKLKENFYNSETMVILESMQDGLLYSNLLLKMYLMSLKSGGILMLNDHLPHTPQTIATFTRHQVGTVERALKVFLEFGLVEILTDGAYYMTDIQLLIGQSSTEGERKKKERMRLKRQKLLPSGGADICPPYSQGDICPPEIRDKRLDIRDTAMFVLGVIVGIIGLLGMGVNYPIYKKLLAQGKQKYAFEIMELAKEISEK